MPDTLISLSVNKVVGVRFQSYTVVCLQIISNHATVYHSRECEALRFWGDRRVSNTGRRKWRQQISPKPRYISRTPRLNIHRRVFSSGRTWNLTNYAIYSKRYYRPRSVTWNCLKNIGLHQIKRDTLFAYGPDDDHKGVTPGSHRLLLVAGGHEVERSSLHPWQETYDDNHYDPHSGARRPYVHFERH